MATKTSRSKPPWDGKSCLRCGGPANIGYDGPSPSMSCAACAAGLFQVLAQSATVLVPLPDHPAAPATDSATPENAPSQATAAALLAESSDAAAVRSDVPPAMPPALADTPRARRRPRPRVRRVPLYEPLTVGLRRRLRRDS